MPTTAGAAKAEKLSSKQKQLVRDHLKEVLSSRAFAGSKRAQDFLHLIVEHALAGEFDSLRERMIGVEMFNRPVDYDTANDSVVRVKATEVRRKFSRRNLKLPFPRRLGPLSQCPNLHLPLPQNLKRLPKKWKRRSSLLRPMCLPLMLLETNWPAG